MNPKYLLGERSDILEDAYTTTAAVSLELREANTLSIMYNVSKENIYSSFIIM